MRSLCKPIPKRVPIVLRGCDCFVVQRCYRVEVMRQVPGSKWWCLFWSRVVEGHGTVLQFLFLNLGDLLPEFDGAFGLQLYFC